jgi:hypothetical protein
VADPTPPISTLRTWAERLVALLDDRFRIPGTDVRFGVDPIIGILFPGIGDAVTGTGSIGLLTLAVHRGVPRVVLWRMVLNILIDLIFGSLPIVGDIFDVAFKANRRNFELIREHESPDSKASYWDYVVVAILVPLAAVFYFGFNYAPALLERLRLR